MSTLANKPKTVEHATMIKLVAMSRRLREYNINFKPSEAVNNKKLCTQVLETVEKECPDEMLAELAELINELGNLDSNFNLDYGDSKENAVSSFFFRTQYGHNPIIQDTLDRINEKRGKGKPQK